MQTKARTDNRTAWLNKLKLITEKIALRDSLFSELCPMRLTPDDEKKLTLERIADASKTIAATVNDALALEAGQPFGVTKLVEKPDEIAATVLLLLSAARLDPNAGRMLRRVEDFCGLVSARDPVVALFVRNFFRADSPVYPHVVMGSGVVQDEKAVMLKESAVNIVFGLASDPTQHQCEENARGGRRW